LRVVLASDDTAVTSKLRFSTAAYYLTK
jgi:hypothetical protein